MEKRPVSFKITQRSPFLIMTLLTNSIYVKSLVLANAPAPSRRCLVAVTDGFRDIMD